MSTSPPATVQNGVNAALNKTKELFTTALQSRNPHNHYIAHLKIWEEVAPETPAEIAAGGSTKKARYLILAVQKDNGKVSINKAKRNANGSFSIGKDWDLNTLREVQVHQPDVFTITLTRPYQWQTQQPREQHLFLQSLVKVYRKYTETDGPNLVGIDVPLAAASSSSIPAAVDTAVSSGAAPPSDPQAGLPPVPSAVATEPSTAATQPLRFNPSPKPTDRIESPVRNSPARRIHLAEEDKSGSPQSHRAVNASVASLEHASSVPVKPPRSESRGVAVNPYSIPAIAENHQNGSHASLTVPAQGLPRSSSNDNLSIRSGSSGGVSGEGRIGGGGNARARLSSIEPIRGGAAYERMLLAGTGLSGVTEVDGDSEDEDPYGGAVLGDDEGLADVSAPKQAITKDLTAVRPDANGQNRPKKRPVGAEITAEEDEDSTLVAVEDMLENFEWRIAGRRNGAGGGKGTADVIEARLLDELAALESANIHAIIESDDRVALVVQHMEEALSHLDQMDSVIAGFKVQLNARADDISHIESQNRGLQVQTSNQRTLMAEIENLINTINVDEEAIHTLSAGRLESSDGIAQLEHASASIYKSMLQARGDGEGGGADMTAAAERLAEHENISTRFCKRVMDYLTVTFNVETQRLSSDPARQKALQPPQPTLLDHEPMEDVLGQYCGLLLYMKEVSPPNFSRVSAAYFASSSECYKVEIQKLFASYQSQLKAVSEDDVSESSFTPSGSLAAVTAIRSGTIRRVGRDKTGRMARSQGDISGQESLQRILASVFPIVLREQSFISDLLHINDNNITFADYMDLEPYFRRRAAGAFGVSAAGPLREMKGALDLVFGFLGAELQSFADEAISKDKMSIFGILATLDRGILDAEETHCESLQKMLSKLHQRLTSQVERFVQEQIKGIEQTKLTVKKRKGVVNFMRVLPVFIERVESQLVTAEMLNTRNMVDEYYNQICRAMFDALQTISRVDGVAGTTAGGDEDKGQLNHLVILIENMCYFVSEITRVSRQKSNSALAGLVQRADTIFNDSLSSYTHLVLRRSLGKMMDYGDGIDGLLQSTPATEVSLHAAYSKASIKKLIKDITAKDTRKAIEALSKRVAKHFGDDDDVTTLSLGTSAADSKEQQDQAEVMGRVWTSCEERYTREFDRITRITKDCYPDLNIKLELGSGEIKRLFSSTAPKRR